MEIMVNYKDLKGRYSNEIEEIVKRIKKSKSKEAKKLNVENKSAEEFKWKFRWCQTIQAVSLGDLLSGKEQQEDKENSLPKAEDLSVSIEASLGNLKRSIHLEEPPQEVWNFYKERLEEGKREEQRLESLTKEEREAECEELLKELRKSPGFQEISL